MFPPPPPGAAKISTPNTNNPYRRHQRSNSNASANSSNANASNSQGHSYYNHNATSHAGHVMQQPPQQQLQQQQPMANTPSFFGMTPPRVATNIVTKVTGGTPIGTPSNQSVYSHHSTNSNTGHVGVGVGIGGASPFFNHRPPSPSPVQIHVPVMTVNMNSNVVNRGVSTDASTVSSITNHTRVPNTNMSHFQQSQQNQPPQQHQQSNPNPYYQFAGGHNINTTSNSYNNNNVPTTIQVKPKVSSSSTSNPLPPSIPPPMSSSPFDNNATAVTTFKQSANDVVKKANLLKDNWKNNGLQVGLGRGTLGTTSESGFNKLIPPQQQPSKPQPLQQSHDFNDNGTDEMVIASASSFFDETNDDSDDDIAPSEQPQTQQQQTKSLTTEITTPSDSKLNMSATNSIIMASSQSTPIVSNSHNLPPTSTTNTTTSTMIVPTPTPATSTPKISVPVTPTPTISTTLNLPKFNKPRHPSPRNVRRPLPNINNLFGNNTSISTSTPARRNVPPLSSSSSTTNNDNNEPNNHNFTTPTHNIRKTKFSLPTPPSTFGRHNNNNDNMKLFKSSSNQSGGANSSVNSWTGNSNTSNNANRFRMPPPISIGSGSGGLLSSSVSASTPVVSSSPSVRKLNVVRGLPTPPPSLRKSGWSSSSGDVRSDMDVNVTTATNHGSSNNDNVDDDVVVSPLKSPMIHSHYKDETATSEPSTTIVKEDDVLLNNTMSTVTEKSSNVTTGTTGEATVTASAQPASSTNNNQLEEEPPLPEGWIDLTVPDTGKKYYLNIETRETQWERPVAAVAAVQSLRNDNVPEMTPHDNHEIEGEVSNSIQHNEILDDYVHVQENDDDMNCNNDVVLQAGEQTEKTEQIDSMNDGPSSNDLPPGWVELVDPVSNIPYYYNEEEGISSWDKPSCAVVSSLEPESEFSSPENTGIQQDDIAEQNSFSPEDTHAVSESVPDGHMDNNDEAAVSQEDLNDVDNNVLPPEWVEMIDPSSGKSYYYNEQTLVSSWDRPASNNDNEDEGENNNIVANAENEVAESELIDSAPTDNNDKNDIAQPSNVEIKGEQVTDDEAALPVGWVEMVDTDTGMTYYFNEAEGLSTWEKPLRSKNEDEVDLDVVDGNADGNVMVQISTLEKNQVYEYEQEQEQNTDMDANETNAALLPEGWVEVIDPGSGLPYYLNKAENVTQWNKPVIESSKATKEEYNEFTDDKSQSDVCINDKMTVPKDISNFQTDNMTNDLNNDQYLQEDHPEQINVNEEAVAEDDLPEEGPEISYDLPPGWVEVIDSSSGLPYYFNETENVMQWDKPVVESQEATDEIILKEDSNVVIGETDETDDLVHPDVHDNHEGHVEQLDVIDIPEEGPGVSANLPPGWVELIDSSSGLPYYFNEADNLTQWDKPVMESPEATDKISKEESIAVIRETDETHGYVKEEEEVAVQKSLDTDDVGAGDNHEDHVQQGNENEEVLVRDYSTEVEPLVSSELPPGWVELIDSGSGLPYYFNEVENVTQWDKPVMESLEATDIPPNEESNELKESDQEPPIPESMNVNTNEDHVDANESKNNNNKEREGTPAEDSEISPVLPPGWVELIDNSSGLPYYFNETENITTWEKPEVDENQDDEPNQEQMIQDEVKELEKRITEDVDFSDELPSGWVEVIDEVSGLPYYYNENDDITSWEKPTPPDKSPDEEDTEVDTNVKENEDNLTVTREAAASYPEINKETNDLPEGWVELIDESSGLPYYFNESENKTTWDKPISTSAENEENMPVFDDQIEEKKDGEAERIDTVNETSASKQNEPSSLPAGWTEVIDPSSGKPYYYNEVENVTTWEKPIQNVKSNITDCDEIFQNESTEGQNETLDPLNKEISAETKLVLPEGWVELVDESSGKNYYYHAVDNVTTWDRPVSSSKSTQSRFVERQRPAHAIATFGFGGKLCVMKPEVADSLSSVAGLQHLNKGRTMRKGPVKLHRLSSLVSEEHLPRLIETNNDNEDSMFGPLISMSDEEVFSYLESKSGEGLDDKELLWKLIEITARWKGRLRSAEGISDPNGPEAAIVNMLLQNDTENLIEQPASLTTGQSNSFLVDFFFSNILVKKKRHELMNIFSFFKTQTCK